MSNLVEWNDVQGLIRRPYAARPVSNFVLLSVTDRKSAGGWLKKISNTIANGDVANLIAEGMGPDVAVNLAFTCSGLNTLGLSDDELHQFSREFVEGMAPKPFGNQRISHRSGMLGDEGENAPENWLWGGYKKGNKSGGLAGSDIDLMLMIYAQTSDQAKAWSEYLVGKSEGVATVGGTLQKSSLPGFGGMREHFGFRDGISQPWLEKRENTKSLDARINQIEPGEMVLGYANERNQKSPVPEVKHDGKTHEFGRNGSYLVFRQLQQNTDVFWEQVEAQATERFSDMEKEKATTLVSASLMGRDVDGKVLTPSLDRKHSLPEPEKFFGEGYTEMGDAERSKEARVAKRRLEKNSFVYDANDSSGLSCPRTAHIRRSFPRDTLGPNPKVNLRLSKRHRILRRGRMFGNGPKVQHPEGKKVPVGLNPKSSYGLYFIALNADIAGQFETIQHSWVNNRHFGGQYDEIDPVAGQGDKTTRKHTLQGRPYNICMNGLQDCIKVLGGGYFFLPGKSAIELLADLALTRDPAETNRKSPLKAAE